MTDVDPRLDAAMREQLARRAPGATRVGWKVGQGDRERIGDGIVVGHLTAATVLEPGSTYRGRGGDLHADAEVAIEVGEGGRPAGYAVALEIVDLGGTDDPREIVAGNIFHRAVAFGPIRPSLPHGLRATLSAGGKQRTRPVPDDQPAERLAAVARVLGAVGEELEPGDRVITGSLVQLPVASGDEVVADIGVLGRVGVRIE
jgi:hypothetical protein